VRVGPHQKRPLVVLDGIELDSLDYLGVGEYLDPPGVVPVVIKSLLFAWVRQLTRALFAGERDGQAGLEDRRGQDQRGPPPVAPEGDEFALGRVEGLDSA
jgi:hypothetical protein